LPFAVSAELPDPPSAVSSTEFALSVLPCDSVRLPVFVRIAIDWFTPLEASVFDNASRSAAPPVFSENEPPAMPLAAAPLIVPFRFTTCCGAESDKLPAAPPPLAPEKSSVEPACTSTVPASAVSVIDPAGA
jgi:hypothetical protein